MSNHLPPALVSNLQTVLAARKGGAAAAEEEDPESQPSISPSDPNPSADASKPVVLVTNADGIGSPGLTLLVEALVRGGRCSVHVCAPDSDRSVSGHSVTPRETLTVSSVEISGATVFELSGTPADSVSLALSGALFSWSRPALVISGINKGSSCGHHNFYSGAIAGAREALICGVPSLSFSLNWKNDESQEKDFKDAVDVCVPLIHAAIRDVENGVFPKNLLLNIQIPTSPSTHKIFSMDNYGGNADYTDALRRILPCLPCSVWENKAYDVQQIFTAAYQALRFGFKVTRQSVWRPSLSWKAVSANRHPPAGQFMSMQQSLGVQLAQLGRDASAAGAARRVTSHRPNVEIESVATVGKPETREIVKKYFRLELLEKEHEGLDEDHDLRALENGFIAVTPVQLDLHDDNDIQTSASDWLASAFKGDEDAL